MYVTAFSGFTIVYRVETSLNYHRDNRSASPFFSFYYSADLLGCKGLLVRRLETCFEQFSGSSQLYLLSGALPCLVARSAGVLEMESSSLAGKA